MKKSDNDIHKFIKDALKHKEKSKKIYLHEPDFTDSNALKYVNSCIESGWVSTVGSFVEKFELKLASFTGAKKAIALTNGTVALRLALHLVGVRYGDEVLVPPLSFVATCNAISHLGAIPHFIDIESKTLGMDPNCLEKHLEEIVLYKNGHLFNKETGRRISAICPVHVFGNPANCYALKEISQKWSLPIVEDAAEALGSSICKKHCGLIGEIGVLSFNGNKIITTGGGGALITNNIKLAERAKHLSTTAKKDHPWEYFHDEIGWNDRMPNINAALGLAQLEKITEKIKYKEILMNRYSKVFENNKLVEVFKDLDENMTSNNWLISLVIKLKNQNEVYDLRNSILEECHKNGIYIRPAWNLLNELPMYKSMPKSKLESAKDIYPRLINLPSSPSLVKNINL